MAKRFYEKVSVQDKDGGFCVMLDGRMLRTPGKVALQFDHEPHAQLVAAEWRDQGDEILPNTMPCTRLMNVACEQTPSRRSELVKEFCAYAGTDLLCYRTKSPQELLARQQQNWQPVLDWAAQKHGVSLASTTGIKAVAQPKTSLQKAQKYAEGRDDTNLTLLLHFTACYGSALLALALLDNHLNAKAAFALSRLDEVYQNERWGADDEVEKNNASLLQELTVLAQLIRE
ncbi:MAG: ATPase [Robiginitomaculum sp.]|nr:MAG: ATPase [Robiginitomaculum sp.]